MKLIERVANHQTTHIPTLEIKNEVMKNNVPYRSFNLKRRKDTILNDFFHFRYFFSLSFVENHLANPSCRNKMALTKKKKLFLWWWWRRRRSQVRRKRYWVHPIFKERGKEGELRALPLILKDEKKCIRYFRMTKTTFESLLELCRPYLLKKDTNFRKAIPPIERLTVTLR